ncbi:MAG: hypothetical protein HZB24_02580 [Desulfobacterales bacterium]|nr:hypothetical protein [Desulfobacterales bacterium]
MLKSPLGFWEEFLSPLRKLTAIYKEEYSIYSTLLMKLTATSILMAIPYLLFISQIGAPVGELTVSFLLLFLFISPWIFLSLDLFAYFKRFRRDRKNRMRNQADGKGPPQPGGVGPHE